MDPKLCLGDAVEHYIAGDYEEALVCLENYRDWRGQRGFEAYPGADRDMRDLFGKVRKARQLAELNHS